MGSSTSRIGDAKPVSPAARPPQPLDDDGARSVWAEELIRLLRILQDHVQARGRDQSGIPMSAPVSIMQTLETAKTKMTGAYTASGRPKAAVPANVESAWRVITTGLVKTEKFSPEDIAALNKAIERLIGAVRAYPHARKKGDLAAANTSRAPATTIWRSPPTVQKGGHLSIENTSKSPTRAAHGSPSGVGKRGDDPSTANRPKTLVNANRSYPRAQDRNDVAAVTKMKAHANTSRSYTGSHNRGDSPAVNKFKSLSDPNRSRAGVKQGSDPAINRSKSLAPIEHQEKRLADGSLEHKPLGGDWKWALQPQYKRTFDDPDTPRVTSALATESAAPLPGVPENERKNAAAWRTIKANRRLFPIVTPIDVDRFEELLGTHPNRAFVQSVVRGLREGFWPSADTSDPALPTTWDNSLRPIRNPKHAAFVSEYRDKEVQSRRWSPSFGTDLKEGMYSMPICVVPKGETSFRLINDDSFGEYSLNGMIPSAPPTIPVDNIQDLGRALHRARHTAGLDPKRHLILWKSDVSSAYRNLPMHPLWQIRQIVTVEGQRYVDRCNHFGNRKAGDIFVSFMSLVLWIAIKVRGIPDLLGYVDDIFSYDESENMRLYRPYGRRMPRNQKRLLELWDELGIPHEDRKQVHGPILKIIGYEVDANKMSIGMGQDERKILVMQIRELAGAERVPQTQSYPLVELQQLAGSVNWAFNVFPLLRPGLTHLHQSMKGKTDPRELVSLSDAVLRDLIWVADHMERSRAIKLFKAVEWPAEDAGLTVYSDASLSGLGYWCPRLKKGFQCRLPVQAPSGVSDSLYWEILAVVSALDWAKSHGQAPLRLLIYCDNKQTVKLFNSMKARRPFVEPMKAAVDILLENSIELRVLWIAGNENTVADALSRFENDLVRRHAPDTVIRSFTPPRSALAGDAVWIQSTESGTRIMSVNN